jgi:hypothetical protein
LPAGRQVIFLQGIAGYVSYARNGVLNRDRIDLSGGVDGNLGYCRPKIVGGYARRQSDLADLDAGRVKNAEEQRYVVLEARCGRGFGFAPVATLLTASVRNSTTARKNSDSDTHGGSLGMSYSRPTFGTLSLLGTYTKTRYPERLVLVGPDELHDTWEIYSAGLRFERQIGSRIRGNIGGSYSALNSNLPTVKDLKGITYDAQLTLQPSYRLQTRLAFTRQFVPAKRVNVSYVIANTYNAEAEYAFGSRLRLIVSGSIKDRTYRLSNTLGTTGPTDERIKMLSGRLKFQANRRMTFELNVENEKRDSNVPLFDFESKRIGLTTKAYF